MDIVRPVPKVKYKRNKTPKNIPKRIRNYVKERDHHQCVLCGHGHNLQLHHLITKGRFDQRLYNLKTVHDPRNLATVCGSCHRLIHDDPEVMKQMLEWQVMRFGEVRVHAQ